MNVIKIMQIRLTIQMDILWLSMNSTLNNKDNLHSNTLKEWIICNNMIRGKSMKNRWCRFTERKKNKINLLKSEES